MTEASKIAENRIKSALSQEEILVKSLWENQDCVITFFRRFGCPFCRAAAKELSGIKAKLDARNVRLVGIGVEETGVKEFTEGKFFDGDLFIDAEKQCYKDLGYKRYGVFSIIPALLSRGSISAGFHARSESLGGDLKGDYYQVGGTLVVTKGGDKVLLSHKQQALYDHVDPAEILKSLNIDTAPSSETQDKTKESSE